jgi:hypothetical protein
MELGLQNRDRELAKKLSWVQRNKDSTRKYEILTEHKEATKAEAIHAKHREWETITEGKSLVS